MVAASAISASASVSVAPELTIKAATLVLGPASVSSTGFIEISQTSSVSGAGQLTSSAINEIGAASSLGASVSVSSTLSGEFSVSNVASASGAVQSLGSLQIHFDSALSSSGTLDVAEVHLIKLGQAHLIHPNGFTTGFNNGFERGSRLTAEAFISQNHLEVITTLTATADLSKVGEASLNVLASLDASHALTAILQSKASLASNGVLLHGGSINLTPVARLQPKLSTEYDNPDILRYTLYIDRSRSLDFSINKVESYSFYIDKQFAITGNIDKINDNTSYIEKITEKTLVRER